MMVLVDERIGEFDLAEALAELPAWRREAALRFRFERDQRLSVAAFRLLGRALREEFGLKTVPEFAFGGNGKPYFRDHPEIHFNLSHCPESAACIVGGVPVGIDVEKIAPVDEGVMEHALSPREIAAVRASASPEVEFARLWTRKEAVLKMYGAGLDERRLPTLLEELASDIELRTEVRGTFVLSTAAAKGRG